MRAIRVRHSGFSLLDLIVVIAIIGLLLAFLLPAVSKVRGAADRAKCMNNIRQLALACHNCNDTYICMPPYLAGPANKGQNNPFSKPGQNGSLLYYLLPFVEQQALYTAGHFKSTNADAYDVNVTINSNEAPANPPKAPFVGQTAVKLFLCPADPTVTAEGIQKIGGENFGSCSYACNYLVFGLPNAEDKGDKLTPASLRNPDGYDGSNPVKTIAPRYAPRIPASFTDGVSNTFLFAEKFATCQWFMAGTVKNPQPGGNAWSGVVYTALDSTGNTAQYAPAFAMESPWNDGKKFQVNPRKNECNVAYPQTGHPSGIVIAMGDASARIVAPAISKETWTALCTPNGGEVIGADF